ncbi:excinuclease ABC subunit UvrA [Anaplasmataceae bacterium AB001_6]|nr:excinuclease ABC subunit UvrA [Anaplasmataceae bacterium AB001_6]
MKILKATHNNLDISLSIPKNRFVVFSGLSGSGKTSLVFNVVHAESQRLYTNSLPAYIKQFIPKYDKPEVQEISGLSPTIAITQNKPSNNPRSTVATSTDLYDYLRLLFARIGIPYSPVTGRPIKSQNVSEIKRDILNVAEGTRMLILADIVKNKKGEHKKELYNIQKEGFIRFKINNTIYEVEEIPSLDKNKHHTISVVVDRLIVRKSIEERLTASIETALKIGEGTIKVDLLDENKNCSKTLIFSEKYACPESDFSLGPLTPGMFSFNNYEGACENCQGLGKTYALQKEKMVDARLSIKEGALKILEKIKEEHPSLSNLFKEKIIDIARKYQINITRPLSEVNENIQKAILDITIKNEKDSILDTIRNTVPQELDKYMGLTKCYVCNGNRLKDSILCVKIGNKNISQIVKLTIEELFDWIQKLEEEIDSHSKEIADKIMRGLKIKLKTLNEIGLGYLSLDRETGTISGGEGQRIKLASQMGCGLTGITYVLDEPSIGLHPYDNKMLVDTIKLLRDLDNSMLVIEHDEKIIEKADYVIDIGPGAGINGGKLIAKGTVEEIKNNSESITGKHIANNKLIEFRKQTRECRNFLQINGLNCNNIKNANLNIPTSCITCVTGVSGSGKSSMINYALKNILEHKLGNKKECTIDYKSHEGLDMIDKMIVIDQKPIGRTSSSTPATYVGLFNDIREWFAALPESKIKGYKIGRFSFNVKGGRCEKCKGEGSLTIDMLFMPSTTVVCDKCNGNRYNEETLKIKYKNRNIKEVLDLTVIEALKIFANIPKIHKKLSSLEEVGLGYMTLGQHSNSLSGGEAQRIKLSKELLKASTGSTIYILDEPTSGLHMEDIRNLLKILHKMCDKGNTVVVIEHNMHLIKNADYIIDIGPLGGQKGGKIIFEGHRDELIKNVDSITGKFLKEYLL